MSLLKDFTSDQSKEIARQVFDAHFKHDSKLKDEMNERRKTAMYQDILYNLSYLEIALAFDKQIFQDYAIWIYELLCHLMPDLSRTRVAQQMVDHYRILGDTLKQYVDKDKATEMVEVLAAAIQTTEAAIDDHESVSYVAASQYSDIKVEYLERLLDNDTRGAIRVILNAVQSGIGIQEIYLHVFKDVMYEVGRLWHLNEISVDKEHYCTSVTQMAIAQFYNEVFSQPRIHRKVLTACVGSELHEMGIRMISDLFEYHGWDSIYLGASVPLKDMLKSIEEQKPELVCLSVTMPHHLAIGNDIIEAIRSRFPNIRIALGGQAFAKRPNLLESFDVDFSGDDVYKLIKWAEGSKAEAKC